jgi:hypothetical protein
MTQKIVRVRLGLICEDPDGQSPRGQRHAMLGKAALERAQ